MGSFRLKECQKVNVLLTACQLFLGELQRKSEFSRLDPEGFLIGSVAEGTRLFQASEIDVTIKFMKLYEQPFQVAEDDGFKLLVPDREDCVWEGSGLAKESFKSDEMKTFDHVEFLTLFLEATREAFVQARKRTDWPEGLESNAEWTLQDCQRCQEHTEKSAKAVYSPHYHCKDCRPLVTHSKIGPCVILTWRDENGEPEVLTLDLIPVFPVHSPRGLVGLFNTATRSLLQRYQHISTIII